MSYLSVAFDAALWSLAFNRRFDGTVALFVSDGQWIFQLNAASMWIDRPLIAGFRDLDPSGSSGPRIISPRPR